MPEVRTTNEPRFTASGLSVQAMGMPMWEDCAGVTGQLKEAYGKKVIS